MKPCRFCSDPEFLERIRAKATPFSLSEAATKSTDVRSTPAT
jgi:hypothetical protein